MSLERKIKLLTVLVVALALCVPAGLLANGATPAPAGAGAGTTQPSATQPVGRGPSTEVASVSQITQRGHVNNMCEAQAMLMDEVQKNGGMQAFGDYQVAYILDPPRGWYQSSNGSLTWRAPAAGETQHIEFAVMDALTGQMIPVTGLTLDVVDQEGKTVQSQSLNYLWHPMISHYGNNYTIPTAGTYTLRARAPAPNFGRHDKTLGNRFTQALDASFTNVQITPKTAPAEEMNGATPAAAGAGPSQPGAVTVPAGQPCPPGTTPKEP